MFIHSSTAAVRQIIKTYKRFLYPDKTVFYYRIDTTIVVADDELYRKVAGISINMNRIGNSRKRCVAKIPGIVIK